VDLNNDDYSRELENYLINLLKKINEELSIGLKIDLIEESLQFYKEIIDSIKAKNRRDKLEIFKERIPIKKLEYLGASLLYFLLNYKINPIKIKISEYGKLTNLARQNIRKVLNFLATFEEVLQKYNLSYNTRITYNFDENNYVSHLNSFIEKFYKQIIKYCNLSRSFTVNQVEEIKEIIITAISSIKKQTIRDRIIRFYNSLDRKVRHPKYLAAVICYIYFRFVKQIYIGQEELVEILNKIEDVKIYFVQNFY